MKPKVFVPHLPTRWDHAVQRRVPIIRVDAALEFGELHLMINPEIRVEKRDPVWAIPIIEEKMELFRPMDYLLAIGNIVLLSAAMHYAQERHGGATLLMWDRQERSYYKVEVSL